jgi:hypothetical protein
MVVKIKYNDGSIIKILSLEEVKSYGIITEDEFINYIGDEFNIEVFSWGECNGRDWDYEIDLRKIFNKNSCTIGGNIVEVELCEVGSYEYTVAVLGLDHSDNIYLKKIWVEEAIDYDGYFQKKRYYK